MQKVCGLLFCIVMSAVCLIVAPAEAEHWGYSGHEGPEHWAELSKEFEACGSGKNQSPIDIVSPIDANLEDVKMEYMSTPLEVVNNGHTIMLKYADGSQIQVEGTTFKLLQVHFHTPSENHIEGRSFPMEAHLVHADSAGNLAVIAVMFSEGDANAFISSVWNHMPDIAGKTSSITGAAVNVSDMLPASREYFRFNGSLTTPPCTEGVRWFVLKDTVEASKEQVEQFHHLMHHDTNRPVQPVYARPVLK